MIVIGVDSHKDILSGCLIDATGKQEDYREIPNIAEGHDALGAWARGAEAMVAIEGSGNFGRPAAQSARQSRCGCGGGCPLEMTAAARRARRTGAKTDQIDTGWGSPVSPPEKTTCRRLVA